MYVSGWGMGLWWLWMILGIVLIVVIVWLVVRALQGGVGGGQVPPGYGGGPTPPREPLAEEVLRARFARGEIDEEEYRRRLAILREGR